MFQNMFTSLVQVAIISFTSWLQKSHFDMSCYSHLLMDLHFVGKKKFSMILSFLFCSCFLLKQEKYGPEIKQFCTSYGPGNLKN